MTSVVTTSHDLLGSVTKSSSRCKLYFLKGVKDMRSGRIRCLQLFLPGKLGAWRKIAHLAFASGIQLCQRVHRQCAFHLPYRAIQVRAQIPAMWYTYLA